MTDEEYEQTKRSDRLAITKWIRENINNDIFMDNIADYLQRNYSEYECEAITPIISELKALY